MKIVYAGTPEFAQMGLQSILDAGHEVCLVLTQPDRPAGRGMKLHPSPVKELALQHGIQVLQPAGLKLDGRYGDEAQEAQKILEALQIDVMVVAAYGLILPQWVLEMPRLGCLNIHASLLPRWRGAAPIHRAIEAGDSQTGVCIMQMDAGLDTGDVLATRSIPIGAKETTGSLHDKLAVLGGEMIVDVLSQLSTGNLVPQVQSECGVCYAHKIDKTESLVDWSCSAIDIERRIRAFDPFPGAVSNLGDVRLKLWGAEVLSADQAYKEAVPGQVVGVEPDSLVVKAGDGYLRLNEVQRPGGKRQPVREFLQAIAVKVGDLFD
ncbi:MAG: methionyl-tRNA formyltransferase [Saezia sp.]